MSSIPLCSFCFKTTQISSLDSDEEEDKQEEFDDKLIIQNFVELAQSYFGEPLKGTLGRGKLLRSCQDCSFVLDSFSGLYKQMRSLEKEVKGRIQILKNVMSSAEKVKSRRKAFKSYSSERMCTTIMIERFRTDFMGKCSEKLSAEKSSTKGLPPPPPLPNIIAEFLKNVPVAERNSVFLALISSFIILLLGVSSGSQYGGPFPPQPDDFSDELDDCLITYSGPPTRAAAPVINLDSDNETVVIPRQKKTETSKKEGKKRKVVEIPSQSESDDDQSDSDSSSSSSSDEGKQGDDDDPDFDIIRIPRKKLYECPSCQKTFKGRSWLENHQRRCSSRGTPSSSSGGARGRGRPSKRARREDDEDEQLFRSTSGGGDGSSPWQMNLMRVIGSLHK